MSKESRQCSRENAHAPHDWVTGFNEFECTGVAGSMPRFTMGEDARSGDVVTIDPHSGLLVRKRT